jgi:hypothetical protein
MLPRLLYTGPMNVFPIGTVRRRAGDSFRLLLLTAALVLLLAACSPPGFLPGQSQQQQDLAQALAYSKCMRSHGVTNYPDPKVESGGGSTRVNTVVGKNDGIDPNSPQFKAAEQACQSLQPGPAGNPRQVAQLKEDGLTMARCMRAHGIASFPDPNSQGVIIIRKGGGVDPHSPQYQAAEKVCQPNGPVAVGIQAGA